MTTDSGATEVAPADTQPTGLRIRGLTVARGGRAVLHGVDLDVPRGQITTLLGPNGAGKSSLVLAAGGLIPTRTGSVLLDGVEMTGRRPEVVRSSGLAVVPEGRRLLPTLTVRENIELAVYTRRSGERATGVEQAVVHFPELRERWDVAAGQLSGGQQQMVVLAQALAVSPSALVVDELSLGLAPVVVKRLVPVLTSVAETGVAVLLIEQFAHVALRAATTAAVLEGGRIRHRGPADLFRENPELLSAAYLLRGHDDALT